MIRKNCGINFDFRDASADDARPEAIEELAAEIFRAPFDLMQGPLYRAVDLRRAANHHVLVFAIHHAIADGWSLGVLVQDLFAAYIEVVMGSSDPLPAVPQTYSTWGADRARLLETGDFGAANRVLANQASRFGSNVESADYTRPTQTMAFRSSCWPD